MIARVISSTQWGSNNRPAPSATSGIAEVLEHATARPQAIASRIGSPKPSAMLGTQTATYQNTLPFVVVVWVALFLINVAWARRR